MVYQVKSKSEFTELLEKAGDTLVMVDFFATWCGPCKRIAPFLEELATKHEGKLTILKIDVDELDEIAVENNISVMPTFVFFKSGKRIESLSGSNEEKLAACVEKNLG